MTVGGDFFKILNFAIAIMRIFGKLFGTDDDKKAIVDSEERSKDGTTENAC